ncbi:outer membrane beta-barrel protein, partial [Sphingobium sp.]|uniref:outer membrane beta-barrel protein n=1 Tax=Sphingobium sp. TaxID=1912891 RepID=UPI002C5F23FF
MKWGLLKYLVPSTALVCPIGSIAQEIGASTSIVIDPRLDRTDVAGARSESEYRPVPLVVGPFLAQPQLSIVSGYEGNVFNQADAKAAQVVTAMPSLVASARLSQHELNLAASGTVRRFSWYRTENSEEFAVAADGRLNLTQQHALLGTFSYASLIEPRSSAASNRNAAE